MKNFPALGQIYLDSPSSIDSYLPEFVLQSDVFNKQVRNILVKISDMETSTTNTLPYQPHQQQFPSFSSVHQEVNFLRKIVKQKNEELENHRKQIDELRQIRISDCNLIEQLEHRIRILEQQRQQEAGRHRSEKENLQERINRIQEMIENIGSKNEEERRVYELEMEVEMLRSRLKEHGEQSVSENIVDSFKIQQVSQQVINLREVNNNLVIQNEDYKLKLQMDNPHIQLLQGLRKRIAEQDSLINSYKVRQLENQQLKDKIHLKDNQIAYQTNTVESLIKQIKSLRQNINQINQQNLNYQSQSIMNIQSHSERQAQYLNRQIQELRTQLQQITKKETQTYEEKLKYERQCYKLTSDLHQLTVLKGDLQSKRFQLEMSKNQLMRNQSQLQIHIASNKELTNSKQYFEEAFHRNEQQKHEMQLRLQSAERQSARNKILQTQINQMSAQLNQTHQKYIDTNTRSSEIVLKYEILLKQNESIKQVLSTSKFQATNYRQTTQAKLYQKQQESIKMRNQNKQLRSINQKLQYQCDSLQNQLAYNDNKLASFQETLLEFQKAYKQLEIELLEIKSSITELQQLQNVFLSKQNHFLDLVSMNVNRLIKYRESMGIEHNYKLQRRGNLLNQIIQIVESQAIEINQNQYLMKTLEENIKKSSSESDKNKLHINTLTFQKQHLFNQLDSVLEKLRYVESSLERQTRMCEMQSQQIEQLKRMNKNSCDRLGEEMQKKVWLQNRLEGSEAKGISIQGMKIERDETFKRMRGMFEAQ